MSDYQEYSNWNLPFKGGVKRTQPYGWSEFAQSPTGKITYQGFKHEGFDCISWDESANPEVLSVCNGTVIVDNDSYSGRPFPAYGTNVIIKQEGTDLAWYYCHLDNNSIEAGQIVKQGQVIGRMGGSGNGIRNAWGSHLHLGLAKLSDSNTRLNQNNGVYGFIDLEPYLTQINNNINQSQPQIQQPMPKSLYQELITINPAFKELWIQGRFDLNDNKATAEMISEVYGWGLNKLSDEDKAKYDVLVQANKNLADQLALTQSNLDGALTDRTNLANRTNVLQAQIVELQSKVNASSITSSVVTNESVVKPEINSLKIPVSEIKSVEQNVPVRIYMPSDSQLEEVKSSLTLPQDYLRINSSTIMANLVSIGVVFNYDKYLGIISGILSFLTYLVSLILQIKKTK